MFFLAHSELLFLSVSLPLVGGPSASRRVPVSLLWALLRLFLALPGKCSVLKYYSQLASPPCGAEWLCSPTLEHWASPDWAEQ